MEWILVPLVVLLRIAITRFASPPDADELARFEDPHNWSHGP